MYDKTGRLTKESLSGDINKNTVYTYDKRGNRTKETITGDESYVMTNTYDLNNRLTKQTKSNGSGAEEGYQYYYDNNGNQTFKQRFGYSTGTMMSASLSSYSNDIESFTYNVKNQLMGYTKGSTTASYTYGANGLRKSKTVGSTVTGFIWNGQNLASETNGSTVKNIYSYGADGIQCGKINGSDILYVKDAHGNTVTTLNGSKGSIRDYTYDAFGNQLSTVASGDTNPFRYCGEYYDNESGNIYLRARYYSPVQGRFITEDPIKDGLNWYIYCNNNSIINIDPTGLDSYILYTTGDGSDFSEQAQWQKSYLESQGERVIMREVNDYDSFIFEWNMIGYDYDISESVEVNKIIIYCHGNDRTLILEEGSTTKALSIDGKNSSGEPIGNLSYLEYKDANELHLMSCNSGHLDPYFAGTANVASIMSQKISGATYAYDGNVSFGSPWWQPWAEDIGMSSRLSTTQDGFRNIASYYGKGMRDPKGKLTYYHGEFKAYGYYPNTSIN